MENKLKLYKLGLKAIFQFTLLIVLSYLVITGKAESDLIIGAFLGLLVGFTSGEDTTEVKSNGK